jgi:hypothetical protein
MALLKEDFVLKLARNVKVVLSLRAGISRGETPDTASLERKFVDLERELAECRSANAELRRQVGRQATFMARLRAPIDGLRNGFRNTLDSDSQGTQLFFVVGHGRSGTTWLQNTLNAHPEVMCRGEGWLFNRNFRREDFKELHPRLKPSSLYNAILNAEYLKLWVERSPWTANDGLSPEDHLDNLTYLAVSYFLTHRLLGTGKRIVGDKTASHGLEALEDIGKVCPEAKVIHMIRDGRDVAVSLAHFLWNHSMSEGGIYELYPEELEMREAYRKDPTAFADRSIFSEKRLAEIAAGWSSEVGQAVRHGPSLLGDRYLEVRYESLLEQPESEVARILRYLGAEARDKTVKSCIEATGFEQASRRKRGEEDSSSVRFRKGVAGDWRNVFTEKDKDIFKEYAGELLVQLGYEKSLEW